MTSALHHTLQSHVDRAATGAPPALFTLHVLSPARGLDWLGAAGEGGHGHAHSVMRIASITKTYVATAVLRLVEQERLALGDPLSARLSPRTIDLLREGGYRPQHITLRMLLDHTSGIADYATQQAFEQRVLGDPTHRWTRDEQIALAMREPRVGEPGERYEYADSNYVLLGEVLEQATGESMPQAIRRLAGFDRLGLRHTWFESLEPVPADAPPRLAQYYDDAARGPVLVQSLDASSDLFGGGGLLSTLPELARYFRALVRGELFDRAGTATLMRAPTALSIAQGDLPYGLGLEILRVGEVELFGHTGYWGVAAWHCLSHDFTLTAAATRTACKAGFKAMVAEAVEALTT
jgi:D-alanyl-D-alanine carboxypeptidase